MMGGEGGGHCHVHRGFDTFSTKAMNKSHSS